LGDDQARRGEFYSLGATEVNMTDWPFAEEIKEVIVQLFRKDNTHGIEEWEALTPIELGVLSWSWQLLLFAALVKRPPPCNCDSPIACGPPAEPFWCA